MVDDGTCMATYGAAGVDSQPPSFEVQWSGKGISTRYQEEGHLARWKAQDDPLPDVVGVLQFYHFKDLILNRLLLEVVELENSNQVWKHSCSHKLYMQKPSLQDKMAEISLQVD